MTPRWKSLILSLSKDSHTLKVELVHQRRWATRDAARRDLFASIEGYCNRQRIHSVSVTSRPSKPNETRVQPLSLKVGEDQ